MFKKCILVLAFLALAHSEYIKTYYRTSSVAFPAATTAASGGSSGTSGAINTYLQGTVSYGGSTVPLVTQTAKTVSSSVVAPAATGTYYQSVQP